MQQRESNHNELVKERNNYEITMELLVSGNDLVNPLLRYY